jgi:hypothetical protein
VVLAVTVALVVVPNSAVAATDSSSVMQSAIDDVQAFWAQELPSVYGTQYDPIPPARLFP